MHALWKILNYTKFGTTEEQNGWQRKFIAEEQRTVYVKTS